MEAEVRDKGMIMESEDEGLGLGCGGRVADESMPIESEMLDEGLVMEAEVTYKVMSMGKE